MSVTGRLLRRRATLGGATAGGMSAPRRLPRTELEAPGRGYAAAAPALSSAAALGCRVTRRVVDEAGRVWRVRVAAPAPTSSMEGRLPDREVLVFQCEEPSVPPEIRRTSRSLTALDNGDLLQLLEYDC